MWKLINRFVFGAVVRNFLKGKYDFTYSPSVSGRRERVMSIALGLPAWPYPRWPCSRCISARSRYRILGQKLEHSPISRGRRWEKLKHSSNTRGRWWEKLKHSSNSRGRWCKKLKQSLILKQTVHHFMFSSIAFTPGSFILKRIQLNQNKKVENPA